MPVVEILLFGVGLSIGAKRAWQKLTGQEDEEAVEAGAQVEEEEERDAGGQSSRLASPRMSPRPTARTARGIENDGLRLFVEDAAALLSPRPAARAPDSNPTSPRSPMTSPRSPRDRGSAAANFSGRRSWLAAPPSPESPRAWWQERLFGDKTPEAASGESASGDEETSTHDEDDVSYSDRHSGEDRLSGEEAGEGFWKFFFRHARQAPAIQEVERGKDEVHSFMRDALRQLAGEKKTPSPRSEPQQTPPESKHGDWNAQHTPRNSVLKSGDTTPRTGSSTGHKSVQFSNRNNVQMFVESEDELQSRRTHWDHILRTAEKEAYEAYLAKGQRKRTSVKRTDRSKSAPQPQRFGFLPSWGSPKKSPTKQDKGYISRSDNSDGQTIPSKERASTSDKNGKNGRRKGESEVEPRLSKQLFKSPVPKLNFKSMER